MKLYEKEINQITRNKSNIQLSIGIQSENDKTIKVFGRNGEEIEYLGQRYEIGSLTKVFTASLLAKYIVNESLELNSSIEKYLPELDRKLNHPNIKQLVTHTSGYSSNLPFSKFEHFKILSEVFFGGQNPFFKTTSRKKLISCLNQQRLSEINYSYKYSNINYSTLGQIINELELTNFVETMTDWIQNELMIYRTNFEYKDILKGYNLFGNKKSNWIWDLEDTAISAGGLYSTANDLLKFAELHQSEIKDYLLLTHNKIFKGSKTYDLSLGWKNCKGTNILWHNGGTGCFSSFLGINKKTKKSVVILSNYRSFRIDSLGLKMLE